MKKLLLLLTFLFSINYVNATITTTGNVDPADPSTWTSSSDAFIGYTSDGTLSVSEGDDILSYRTYIAVSESTTSSATITGTGSTWTNYLLYIGNSGTGTLNIENGGIVTSQHGASIAANSTANGTVNVSGSGSQWITDTAGQTDWLHVGNYGTGALNISDGGIVNSEVSVIGNNGGSGTATVTDEGSQWINTNILSVGHGGTGILNIENGGAVSNTTGYIGGITGTVNVRDANSTWTNSDMLRIGDEGSGILNITNGGTVIDNTGYIGYYSDANGTVLVDGANSQWTNSSTLSVGYYGDGTLNIENGGSVSSYNGSIGDESGSTGIVTVTDANSTWTNSGDLIVGESGTGTLNIENGGAVSNAAGFVGYSDDTNGVAIVTGTGSTWTNSDYITIGDNGNGTLTISDGGTVSNAQGHIGYSDNATGIVDVNNGTWTNYSYLYVGVEGTGTLTIQNGGTVTNSSGIIANDSTSTGTVTVDNGTLTNGSALQVGRDGTGTLTVQNGGTVSNTFGYIGNRAGSTGTATITGTGSTWTNENTLYVGNLGDGTLTISDGGVVTNATAYIGFGSDTNGIATVTGTDSRWTNSNPLCVGYDGNGTLNVTDGGLVRNTDGYIAHNNNSTSSVTVSGTYSRWLNSDNLYIGSNGTGSLNISNGGLVAADNAVIGSHGTLSGNSTLALDGGNGTLTNYGIIAPGNSIGTLTVEGDVVFHDGSTLEAEIDNAGNSDKLDVTGDVTINTGSTLAINSNGETIENGKSYTLIEADGSVTGEFTTLNTSLVTWDTSVEGSVSYNTSSVVLTASVNNFDDTSIFFTDNQIELGSTIQRIVDDGGTIGGLTSSIQNIVGDDNLRSAYNQLSGQTRASLAPIANSGVSHFTNIVSGRMMNTKIASLDNDNPMVAMADNTFNAYSMLNNNQDSENSSYGFWAKGLAAIGDRDNDNSVNGYDYRLGGFTVGFDKQITENFLGGIIIGYSNTDVEYQNSYDNSKIDSIYTGLYGSYLDDDGYIDGIFTYSNFANKTERYVNFLSEKLDGDFDGYEFSGYLEAAQNHNYNGLLIQPLVGFGVGYQNHESYTEEGGSSALDYKTQRYESYKSSLGARFSKVFKQENGSLLLGQFRAKWNHEFGDAESDITASFASTPGYNFTIKDSDMDRDSAILGVGLKYEPNSNTRLILDYDTIINGDSTSQILGASLKIMW